MKTTRQPLSYARRPTLRHVSPAYQAMRSPNTFLADGQGCSVTPPRMISPVISQATRNVGLMLYEILGMVELLRVAYEKGELTSVEARLSLLISEATNLASSVSNILELTQLETEPTATDSEQFDIVALLHEVSQETRMIVGNKPVTVMDASCPGPVVIKSDPVKIRQIMTELLSNASKFTDRGRIALILGKDDDKIRLTVADTGKGMTPEQINAVFESSDRGYDADVNGLAIYGLGLRIVKSLVKKINGSISVSSKVGEGTIVEVSLPLEPQGKSSDTSGGTQGEPTNGVQQTLSSSTDLFKTKKM